MKRDMDLIRKKLARWGNELNNWEWPDDMPNKPQGWDDMARFYKKEDSRRDVMISKSVIIKPIAGLIDIIIGEKELSKWHHINNLGRTSAQFDEWWEKERDEPLAFGEAITKGWV